MLTGAKGINNQEGTVYHNGLWKSIVLKVDISVGISLSIKQCLFISWRGVRLEHIYLC